MMMTPLERLHATGSQGNSPTPWRAFSKCEDILERFIDSLQKLDQETTDPEILGCVKNVVLELNKLNESVGGGLIETMEREDLYEYITFAARRSGLKTGGDVTEEWREW
jgi:hypothetical protein